MKNFVLSTFKIILVLIILGGGWTFSQNVEFTRENFPEQKKLLKKAIRLINKGDECFSYKLKGMYAKALDFYLEANNFNPNNALLNYKIGVCYIESYYKNNGIHYLENALKLDSMAAEDLYYYIGRAYQYNALFPEAIAAYEHLKKSIPEKEISYVMPDVTKRIKECEFGLEFQQSKTRLKVSNIGGDINSMWDDYCPVVSANDSILAFTTRRLFEVGKNKLNKYDYMYYENILFSFKDEDDEWVVPVNPGKPLNTKLNDATVDISPDGSLLTIYKNKNGQQFLFESKFENGAWSKPKKLSKEINRRNAYQTTATYSKDNNTIYFTSEQKEGHGGLDIYISKKDENGEWGSALNLGNRINTLYDEDAVFLLNDSILYFGSKGHNSMGEFDIYFTKQVNDEWIEPVNLGIPVNSPGNDMYIFFNGLGNAYFSSDRQGGTGAMDIYYAKYQVSHEELIAGIPSLEIISQFVDENSNEAVFADMDVKDLGSELVILKATTDSSGFSDMIVPSAGNYLVSVYLKDCDYAQTTHYTSGLGTKYAYMYDPDLRKNDTIPPTIINGFVVDPITMNPVQPKFDVMNVQTGEKVAVIIPDTNGNFSITLPSALEYKFLYKTTGCTHKKIVVQNVVNYTASNIEGSNVLLENIYFDYDRHNIRADAIEILNRHASLFNLHKEWKVIIEGHTDNMGSLKYNMFLSKQRALAAIDYLAQKGIKRNRLKYRAFGYEKPVTTNETPEGRQLNRRVEFKIID